MPRFTLTINRITLDADPESGRVTGPGEAAQLEPKVAHLLAVLCEARGQVVSREQLLSEVWEDRVVSDDVMSRAIYQLRRSLTAAAGTDLNAVQTLRKRGFRLLGQVTGGQATPVAKAATAPLRWLPALLVVAAAAGALLLLQMQWSRSPAGQAPEATPATVAVLPFVNMSGDSDTAFFSDGLSEELIHHLTYINGLKVVARTSSFVFRGQEEDIRLIAGELGATHLIEGSVRRDDKFVRITAQLIEGSGGTHLWSQTYDTMLSDVISVQETIARRVADSLSLGFAQPTRQVANSDAYLLYLQGREYLHVRDAGALAQARDYFEQAIVSDPDFAPAYSGLSDALMLGAQYANMPLNEATARARQAVRKALAIDPDNAEAMASEGLIALQNGDYEPAGSALRRATALDDNYAMAHMWLGRSQELSGNLKQAMVAYARAVALDPLSPIANMNLGMRLCDGGQPLAAIEHYQRALKHQPDFANIYWAMGHCHLSYSAVAAAEQAYLKALGINSTLAEPAAQLALVYLDLGDLERAMRWADDAVALGGDIYWAHAINAVLTAAAYARGENLDGVVPPKTPYWQAVRRGVMASLDEDWVGARDAFEAALSMDPDAFFSRRELMHGFGYATWLLRAYNELGEEAARDQLSEVLAARLTELSQQGLATPGLAYVEAALDAVNGKLDSAQGRLAVARKEGYQRQWWPLLDPSWAPVSAESGVD